MATTCESGKFLASDDNECHPCSKLVAYCTNCTSDGICTSCNSSHRLTEKTIKDNSDPKNGEKRTVKHCEDLPFFSKWYGIVVILLAPLLIGAIVAVSIKFICDRR